LALAGCSIAGRRLDITTLVKLNIYLFVPGSCSCTSSIRTRWRAGRADHGLHRDDHRSMFFICALIGWWRKYPRATRPAPWQLATMF